MTRLARALTRAGGFAMARPRLVVALWLLAAAVSMVVVGLRLELATSNLDLVDAELPAVADFIDVAETFGTPNQLVVVLEGEPSALRPAADELAEAIGRLPGVAGVLSRVPIDPMVALSLGIEPYFVSRDGGMAFVFVIPADHRSSATTLAPVVEATRGVLASAGLKARGLKAGLTGVPAYALDDRDVIQRDVTRLTWVSLVLVLVLFVLGFGALRRPLLAVVTLLVAVAVALGVAAVVPGRLTLLSASFLSILFGLGIDAGIHLVDRVEEERSRGGREAEALRIALQALAPGLLTATMTTASVLWVLLASGLRGFAELGLVAGNGLVVCLLATVTLLPALLVLSPATGQPRRPAGGLGPLARVVGRPVVALVVVVMIALTALVVPRPGFDADYLDLQPPGSETVRLEREMTARSEYSPQSMVFRVPDRAAAVALVARLRAEPQVGAVRSVLDLELVEQFGGHPPAPLRAMVEAADGSLAVWAAPREEVWSPAARDAFAARMLAIDPHATGMPVLGAFIVERSRRALVVGGLLGALVLVGWVLFDLRSLRWSLLALAPTACTAAALGPAMVLLGLEWNPIDVVALPVVLGIAVDDGIHLVHRYRAEAGDLVATFAGTGRGVVLTSLTTLAAFLSLAFASHPGLASFAAVVSLGVAIALICSLVVLPGLLVLAGKVHRIPTEVG